MDLREREKDMFIRHLMQFHEVSFIHTSSIKDQYFLLLTHKENRYLTRFVPGIEKKKKIIKL